MVFSRLKVDILFSRLRVKRCVSAGIKTLGWYYVGRVRDSLVLKSVKLPKGLSSLSITAAGQGKLFLFQYSQMH